MFGWTDKELHDNSAGNKSHFRFPFFSVILQFWFSDADLSTYRSFEILKYYVILVLRGCFGYTEVSPMTLGSYVPMYLSLKKQRKSVSLPRKVLIYSSHSSLIYYEQFYATTEHCQWEWTKPSKEKKCS